MDGPANSGPLRYLVDLPDPRAANVRHRLPDLRGMALCAVICDAEGWDECADFVRVKAKWLTTFLDLQHGVRHDDHESTDADHGRIETRRVWVADQLDWLKQAGNWRGWPASSLSKPNALCWTSASVKTTAASAFAASR